MKPSASTPLYGARASQLQPDFHTHNAFIDFAGTSPAANWPIELFPDTFYGFHNKPPESQILMPAAPEDLFNLLEELKIETTTHEHEAVFTVSESEKIKHDIPGGHTKNLFLKDKKGNYFLIVAEGHSEIRLNSVHGIIGARGRVSFGKPEDLMALLGVPPGSVTAFAPMNDIDAKVSVIIDAPLLKHELINCHPLTNEMTTTISREDLLRFLAHVGHEPHIVQVSEGADQ